MIGPFFSRAFIMVLGYAYPAYECYKTVEMNRPEVQHLRFWCQYWILVAMLTVFERFADTFISWLPMYSEAKLTFFVYLWHSKTKGTTYVYETFFKPYVANHEQEIDRNLLELRTRAGDIVVLCWQRAARYGQTRFLEIMKYVASQSQSSRTHHAQEKTPQQVHLFHTTAPPSHDSQLSRQTQQIEPAPSAPLPPPPPQPPSSPRLPPFSPTMRHRQEATKTPRSPFKSQKTSAPSIRPSPEETELPSIKTVDGAHDMAAEESAGVTRRRTRGSATAVSPRCTSIIPFIDFFG